MCPITFVPNTNKIGKILYEHYFWVHYFLNAPVPTWGEDQQKSFQPKKKFSTSGDP